jgi:PAS domain S-box-containing protein
VVGTPIGLSISNTHCQFLAYMQSNLTLLKTVGWQALDLDLPTSELDGHTGTDIVHHQEAGDVWTTLFDHAPCAIAIADGTGRFTRINRKFCVLTGFAPNEIINRPFNELIDEFGGSQATSPDRQKPTNSDHICAISRQDGSKVWCRQKTVPCGQNRHQAFWTICYFDELSNSSASLDLILQSQQILAGRQ